MQYTYEDILQVQRGEKDDTVLPRENAVFPETPRVAPRYVFSDGKWVNPNPRRADRAKLLLAGDLLCPAELMRAKRLNGDAEDYRFDTCFKFLRRVLSKADLAMGNLEAVIHPQAPYASEEALTQGMPNRNAPPQFAESLRAAGFDLVTTANNHMADTGMRGTHSTITHLDRYGLMHTGTFVDSETPRYVLADVNGILVGVLSYTLVSSFVMSSMLDNEQSWMLNHYDAKTAKKDIAALRKAGAEYIIVCPHWGGADEEGVTAEQKRTAQELANFGADFIAGSHPHTVQAYDVLKGKGGKRVPVIYSMGRLLAVDDGEETRTGVLIELDLRRTDKGVRAREHYLACYTFHSYKKCTYTVVPLANRVFTPARMDARMQDLRRRTAAALGTGIRPSHTFDLKSEELDALPDYTADEAIRSGFYLMPKTTEAQAQILERMRTSEAFREEYRSFLRTDPASKRAIREAVRVSRQYLKDETVTAKANWELISDLIYSKQVLGFEYWEYFVYELRDLSVAERLEFAPQSLNINYYRKVNRSKKSKAILRDKYKSYLHLKKFYKRDIIEVKSERDWSSFALFCRKHPKFLVKPLSSSLGKGVQIIDTEAGERPLEDVFRELTDTYLKQDKTDFLCEELIIVDPTFAAIHPSSVNSLRLFTYNDGVEPKVVLAWMKTGKSGIVVDNGVQGGVLAAIDHKTGTVISDARNQANETFETHPDSGFVFKGFEIPRWNEAVETAKQLALAFPDMGIIGWDLALSADKGWQAIEGNSQGLFSVWQVAARKGLRREFLQSIEWERHKDK